jgi:hypothetical protein
MERRSLKGVTAERVYSNQGEEQKGSSCSLPAKNFERQGSAEYHVLRQREKIGSHLVVAYCGQDSQSPRKLGRRNSDARARREVQKCYVRRPSRLSYS